MRLVLVIATCAALGISATLVASAAAVRNSGLAPAASAPSSASPAPSGSSSSFTGSGTASGSDSSEGSEGSDDSNGFGRGGSGSFGSSGASGPPSSELSVTGVDRLQAELARLGYFHHAVTGYYGPVTTAAVKRFQRATGLRPDGIWGPRSAAALARRLG